MKKFRLPRKLKKRMKKHYNNDWAFKHALYSLKMCHDDPLYRENCMKERMKKVEMDLLIYGESIEFISPPDRYYHEEAGKFPSKEKIDQIKKDNKDFINSSINESIKHSREYIKKDK